MASPIGSAPIYAERRICACAYYSTTLKSVFMFYESSQEGPAWVTYASGSSRTPKHTMSTHRRLATLMPLGFCKVLGQYCVRGVAALIANAGALARDHSG
jgi:acyl-CoA synthetase (AMP-forming)/AMP-acid ligase II